MSDKWESLALCVFFMCCCAAFIVHTMAKADANADCWERGGVMREIYNERQCVKRGNE